MRVSRAYLPALIHFSENSLPDTRLSPAQVVFGRHMRDLLPTLNYKYEPGQEWGSVREYRERAMARRLDRDGADWSSTQSSKKLFLLAILWRCRTKLGCSLKMG